MTDRFDPPPDMTGKKLDFSMWHPFDHPVWSKRCTEFYGGRRNHLRMKWDWIIKSAIRSHTLCRIGIHTKRPVWKMRDGKADRVFLACTDCGKRMSNDQQV